MTLLELWSLSLARMGESVRPVFRRLSSPDRRCLFWPPLPFAAGCTPFTGCAPFVACTPFAGCAPFAGCSAAANEHSSTSEFVCASEIQSNHKPPCKHI